MTLDGKYFTPLNKDTSMHKMVGALAFHGYTSNGVTAAQMSATKLGLMYNYARSHGWELWQTENAGSMGVKYVSDVIACLRYGKVSMYLKYGLTGNSVGMVGSEEEFYYFQGNKTKTYYAAKTVSKFIRPGSIQLRSVSSDSAAFCNFVAFYDKAATALIVTLATGADAQTITLSGTNLPSTFQKWVTNASTNCVNQGNVSATAIPLPANSAVTLYGTGYTPPATSVHTARVATTGRLNRSERAFAIDGRRIPESRSRVGAGRASVIVTGDRVALQTQIRDF
jgi:hypothetical protein